MSASHVRKTAARAVSPFSAGWRATRSSVALQLAETPALILVEALLGTPAAEICRLAKFIDILAARGGKLANRFGVTERLRRRMG